MGRAATKSDMITAAISNYEKLNKLISELTEAELSVSFDFTADDKKKEAHWGRDKNLRDVLVHLYEWHQLVLNWVQANKNGENKPFIPAPYNWKTTGNMNVGFWEMHQSTPLEEAKEMFKKSHEEVLYLAESFSNEELFSKDVYKWVG